VNDDLTETIAEVKGRLASFSDRPHRHWPRWTIADYAKVGVLASGAATALSTIRELQTRVAELERRLNPPCGDPSIDAFYLEADKEET
jgi:hypothetical protein